MHGPLAEPERGARPERDPLDPLLRLPREPRRRHVDGLLEERAVERVRLVEERERLEPARHEEPLERDLAAGDELLDEQRAGGLAAHGDVVAPEERGDAPEGGDELVRAVRADHAPARRERPRLQHARVGRAGGRARRVLRERDEREARLRHAGGAQALAHRVLVARGRRGGDRVGLEAEARGDGGGDDGGQVVHRDDGVDRAPGGEAGDLRGGAVGVAEVERQQVVGDLRLERAGLLGRAHEVHAETGRGVDERLGAVRRGRQEQQQPR